VRPGDRPGAARRHPRAAADVADHDHDDLPDDDGARLMGTRLAVGVVAVVGLAGLVVGGILFLRDEDPSTDYDARTEDDFMATCTADADELGFARSAPFCRCAYDAIRAEVPYDRFLAIDEALQADPAAVPDEIDRIRTACYVEVESTGEPTIPTPPSSTTATTTET
jgi:hypothetical protein